MSAGVRTQRLSTLPLKPRRFDKLSAGPAAGYEENPAPGTALRADYMTYFARAQKFDIPRQT